MRVVIAMMKHETNTFSPVVTDWARFEAWSACTGAAVARRFAGTRMPVAAYLHLAEQYGAEVVTPLAAEAMPSGPVTRRAFEHMAGLICEAVRAGCDAVLLDLHGAMVVEPDGDGEGLLLERIRRIAPGIPVAVTCDLHCNLSAAMVDNASAMIGYKTYPHVDMYEVAEQIGRVLFDTLAGHHRPCMSWGHAGVLSQTLRQGTDDEPMRGLMARARTAEARPGILAVTVFGGFALADVADAGTSVLVVSDADPVLADAVRDELLAAIRARREDFVYRHRPLAESIEAARRLGAGNDGPVLLLDHADNCGSGATQDVMTVIRAVHEAALDDVIVAAVWDPEAVAQMQAVGIGSELELDLGGRTDMPAIGLARRPLRLRGRVKTLSDGRWTVHGPMYTGVQVDMGPSAVLDTGRMQIVVVSRHHEPWDQGVLTALGITPHAHRHILLKSRIHYRAGFAGVARHTLTLDGEGVTTSDNRLLRYQRVRRPVYPLDLVNEAPDGSG